MNKKQTRDAAYRFLSEFGQYMHDKFSNICGKTAAYEVPSELFQKRTNRRNRVLMPWRDVISNNLTLEQLNTFEGGITVEFVNNDFFNEENLKYPIFNVLRDRLGSDENVSSIISIRSTGKSSSNTQREAFDKLTNNTLFNYKGTNVIINKSNFTDFKITRPIQGGMGNEKWEGFIYVSIRGGQQDTIRTHKTEVPVFNPACEYASSPVQLDIDLVSAYFAFHSIDISKLSEDKKTKYTEIIENIEQHLRESYYDNSSYSGNLYDYCSNHLSLKLNRGKLTDPIQVIEINIADFNIIDVDNERNIDFTHDEAVNYNRYYWDKSKQCVLSPTRPTNIFWSLHESNMMQQNRSLNEYLKMEEERYLRRKSLLGN